MRKGRNIRSKYTWLTPYPAPKSASPVQIDYIQNLAQSSEPKAFHACHTIIREIRKEYGQLTQNKAALNEWVQTGTALVEEGVKPSERKDISYLRFPALSIQSASSFNVLIYSIG